MSPAGAGTAFYSMLPPRWQRALGWAWGALVLVPLAVAGPAFLVWFYVLGWFL
jgi:ABC-type uncharacterized transport system permease subunit